MVMTAPAPISAPGVERTIPVMRPLLPDAASIFPYLERIDASRWYSNFGPLEQEFRHRLGTTFGMDDAHIVTTASSTSALQIAARASARAGKRKCLLPSWTFSATPLAVINAGLEPHFVDIDSKTWSISPDQIMARKDLDDVALIIVVAPFGAPPDIQAWNRVQAATGVPIVVDAAASFDAISQDLLASQSTFPIIISLHATKSFGIGEGGVLLCNDAAFVRQCDKLRNFGFQHARVSQDVGTNAKLSEYAAAVGLAALDQWPTKRRRFAKVHDRYQAQLAHIGGVALSPSGSGEWISSTYNVTFPSDFIEVSKAFKSAGIDVRQWWGQGCHVQPAFLSASQDTLTQTENLTRKVVGLPMSVDLAPEDIDVICQVATRATRV